MNHCLYGGDAKDACAYSPPPSIPTFVSINDPYAEWYKDRFGQELDRSLVLPVLHALQGHPKSGRLWEGHINPILFSLGFRYTTHDRSIYSATIDNEKVLMLRQVDDFAIVCSNEDTAKQIYHATGAALQLPTETSRPFNYLGLLKDYN